MSRRNFFSGALITVSTVYLIIHNVITLIDGTRLSKNCLTRSTGIFAKGTQLYLWNTATYVAT